MAAPVLVLAFCPVSFGAKTLQVPLRWMPTDKIEELDPVDLSGLRDIPIAVSAFEDSLTQRDTIGKNVEQQDKGVVKVATTPTDIAGWSTQRFSDILRLYKMKLVGAGHEAAVRAEILRFFVVERDMYKATVELRVKVYDSHGQKAWEGVTNCESERWGLSFRADNYRKVLCNAFLGAVHAVLSSPQFCEAIQSAAQASRMPPPDTTSSPAVPPTPPQLDNSDDTTAAPAP